MFPAGDERPVALTPPDLGLPTDVLDALRLFCKPPWAMVTALGRVAVRPGPCDQRLTGMGMDPPALGGRWNPADLVQRRCAPGTMPRASDPKI